MDPWMRKLFSNQQAALTTLYSNLITTQSSLKGYYQEISSQYRGDECPYLMAALDEMLASLQTDLKRCEQIQDELRKLEQLSL